MNQDQIKKLIRLANNNPNDHEANQAARRACKAIEENGFKLDESKVKSTQTRYPNPSPPSDWVRNYEYQNPYESMFKTCSKCGKNHYKNIQCPFCNEAEQNKQNYNNEFFKSCRSCGNIFYSIKTSLSDLCAACYFESL